jgi:hypothetical protein
MIQFQSITTWFATHGTLRKSQRTTIAALAWALMQNPVLGIAAMGRSLAMAGNTTAKHAIKRVNRFLGNTAVNLEVACGDLIATVVGDAQEVVLTLDWTDPKTKDSQFQTLSINLRAHGRALPLLWKTVRKTDLKGRMREYEEALCTKAAALLPAGCQVILLADRGFATVQFFRFLDCLGWDWVIRSKGNVLVRWKGAWIPLALLGKGRPVHQDGAVDYGKKAAGGSYAGRLVVYADATHPDPWFLLVSDGLKDRPWGNVVALYGQRFTCEESYKDQKNDPYAGFHMDCVKLGTEDRWDRLWLVFSWAYYWLNVGGWAVEQRGDARHWRANSTEKRTHALWRLAQWALAHHDLVWRTFLRSQKAFGSHIPPLGEVPAPA